MSTFTVRPARRSEAKPLIGFYAESGGGKTRAALTLARGFVGPTGKIVMIETESGRGESYAGDPKVAGHFDVVPLRYDPQTNNQDAFSSENYGKAITAAEQFGADALIIDSASHEWEGIGGVLDWADENKENGKKGMQVWTQPKIMHQRHFISRLLMTPIPLVILCLRAKFPMEETKNKEMKRSDKLEPKQSADILYDLFVHGWFDREEHLFHATHYQDDTLADVLRSGQKVTHATGEALARWSQAKQEPVHVPVPVTLTEILERIDGATDKTALGIIGLAARGLPDGDKATAGSAYKARMDTLT